MVPFWQLKFSTTWPINRINETVARIYYPTALARARQLPSPESCLRSAVELAKRIRIGYRFLCHRMYHICSTHFASSDSNVFSHIQTHSSIHNNQSQRIRTIELYGYTVLASCVFLFKTNVVSVACDDGRKCKRIGYFSFSFETTSQVFGSFCVKFFVCCSSVRVLASKFTVHFISFLCARTVSTFRFFLLVSVLFGYSRAFAYKFDYLVNCFRCDFICDLSLGNFRSSTRKIKSDKAFWKARARKDIFRRRQIFCD